MQKEDLTLEQKIDRLLDALPVIEALGTILIRQQTIIERTGMSRTTLDGKEKHHEYGRRKTYIEIGEIATVKRRKSAKKRTR